MAPAVISIHAPHTGRDDTAQCGVTGGDDFNPRAPYGARPNGIPFSITHTKFQSTRPIRGATRFPAPSRHCHPISIHAPHTGRDCRRACIISRRMEISIHAPHTGRDTWSTQPQTIALGISIHAPHTGRDVCGWYDPAAGEDFNPRAPYGARRDTGNGISAVLGISIHAPHTGRDIQQGQGHLPVCQISIHAPHTGRDASPSAVVSLSWNFNPRAPYGARQQKCIIYVLHFCNNRQSKHKNQQETSSVRTFF